VADPNFVNKLRRVRDELNFIVFGLAVPFNFCPSRRGDPLWQINRHYGVETDYCCVAWRHLAAAAAWMIKYFMRPFLLVPFACAPQHQAPAPRISSRQKRWSENDDKMRARFWASERAYSNYTRRGAQSVLVIMRARCQPAERQNNKRKRRPRHGTWPFYCMALLATAIFKFAGACWREKLCPPECIINL
jgi:hypothetical protein